MYVIFKSIGYVYVIKSWLFLRKMADYYKIRKHTSKLLLEHILHTSHHKSIRAFASPVLNMVIHLGIHVVLVGLTVY